MDSFFHRKYLKKLKLSVSCAPVIFDITQLHNPHGKDHAKILHHFFPAGVMPVGTKYHAEMQDLSAEMQDLSAAYTGHTGLSQSQANPTSPTQTFLRKIAQKFRHFGETSEVLLAE